MWHDGGAVRRVVCAVRPWRCCIIIIASLPPPLAVAVVAAVCAGSPFDLALQAQVAAKKRRLHKPEALKRLEQGACTGSVASSSSPLRV